MRIRLNDLIKKLQTLEQEHGNIVVILQSDPEGNYYEFPRGVKFGYHYDAFGDDIVYKSQQDALDDDATHEDLLRVIVIYP